MIKLMYKVGSYGFIILTTLLKVLYLKTKLIFLFFWKQSTIQCPSNMGRPTHLIYLKLQPLAFSFNTVTKSKEPNYFGYQRPQFLQNFRIKTSNSHALKH